MKRSIALMLGLGLSVSTLPLFAVDAAPVPTKSNAPVVKTAPQAAVSPTAVPTPAPTAVAATVPAGEAAEPESQADGLKYRHTISVDNSFHGFFGKGGDEIAADWLQGAGLSFGMGFRTGKSYFIPTFSYGRNRLNPLSTGASVDYLDKNLEIYKLDADFYIPSSTHRPAVNVYLMPGVGVAYVPAGSSVATRGYYTNKFGKASVSPSLVLGGGFDINIRPITVFIGMQLDGLKMFDGGVGVYSFHSGLRYFFTD